MPQHKHTISFIKIVSTKKNQLIGEHFRFDSLFHLSAFSVSYPLTFFFILNLMRSDFCRKDGGVFFCDCFFQLYFVGNVLFFFNF